MTCSRRLTLQTSRVLNYLNWHNLRSRQPKQQAATVVKMGCNICRYETFSGVLVKIVTRFANFMNAERCSATDFGNMYIKLKVVKQR